MDFEEGHGGGFTLDGLYYAGRVVIEKVVSREPFLLEVQVLDAAQDIDMCIPFPKVDLKKLCQCKG